MPLPGCDPAGRHIPVTFDYIELDDNSPA